MCPECVNYDYQEAGKIKIEILRKNLHRLAKEKELSDDDVVRISQQLDRLLVNYAREEE